MIGREPRGIEQHDGGDRAHRRAEPETAVDDEVGPAAIARRHQFLDRRIDRGVFAADAGAGEETKECVARHAPRQRGCRGRREIDRKRDEEQFLAPDPVGEPAKAERAEHGAGEIGAVGNADIEIGEFQRRAFLERARQCAGERHFQAIENPGDAERQHDTGVKSAPAQIIEPRRNAGLDDAVIVLRYRRGSGAPSLDAVLRRIPCKSIASTNEQAPREPLPQGSQLLFGDSHDACQRRQRLVRGNSSRIAESEQIEFAPVFRTVMQGVCYGTTS